MSSGNSSLRAEALSETKGQRSNLTHTETERLLRRCAPRNDSKNWRFWPALWLGKATYRLIHLAGRGGGTAAPGLVALAIAPDFVTQAVGTLPGGSLMVTGTNGKTTTTRMLGGILQAAGHRPLSNRQGSNLLRGLASTALVAADGRGRLAYDIGLWETDEAAFLPIAAAVRPRLAVVNNLFRDQLDRYGEVEKIRRIWQQTIAGLGRFTEPPAAAGPASSILVLNADDPAVAHLGQGFAGPVWYFGLDDPAVRLAGRVHAMDVRTCLVCDGPLTYRANFLSHLGDYFCPRCGFARPTPQVAAIEVRSEGLGITTCRVRTPTGTLDLRLNLSGLYNVYNALAAVTAALALGIAPATVQQALAAFRPAFGRFERLRVMTCHHALLRETAGVMAGQRERDLYLLLVKNPTGFNEVLRTLLAATERPLHLCIAINDLIADGRDVSWLWDVDFEVLAGRLAQATISGIRANDMALRLKYAGLGEESIVIESNLERALARALAQLPPGETLFCLPTYTAMLTLQGILARWGVKEEYWEE
jgi:UDP-N-acetylmuramyl tripeptide synthase